MRRTRSKLPLAFCFLISCMAENDLHQFTNHLMRTPQLQALSDEMAYSYPVPLKNGHVVVYSYMLIGRPPDMPKVSVPNHYIEAAFPSGNIIHFRSTSLQTLGVTSPDGKTLGAVHFPSEYLLISPDEFNRREDEFGQLYSHVITAYLSSHRVDATAARQVLAQLPVFAKAPLIPLFRVTNPDFFSWLETAAKS